MNIEQKVAERNRYIRYLLENTSIHTLARNTIDYDTVKS